MSIVNSSYINNLPLILYEWRQLRIYLSEGSTAKKLIKAFVIANDAEVC